MASSVTVDDELRKKIKKLAAEHDTTQGEIIKIAIELYEKASKQMRNEIIPEARSIIKQDLERHEREDWKKEIRKKLTAPGIDIDEMRMEVYEFEQN